MSRWWGRMCGVLPSVWGKTGGSAASLNILVDSAVTGGCGARWGDALDDFPFPFPRPQGSPPAVPSSTDAGAAALPSRPVRSPPLEPLAEDHVAGPGGLLANALGEASPLSANGGGRERGVLPQDFSRRGVSRGVQMRLDAQHY